MFWNVPLGPKSSAESVPVVLSTDQLVSIPTPASIVTFVKDGIVFSLSTEVNLASKTLNNPVYLLRNPALSGKVIYLWELLSGVDASAVNGIFHIHKNPTVAADGTPELPSNRDIGNVGLSAMEIFSLPTILALGPEMVATEKGQNSNHTNYAAIFSLFVEPGNTILVTGKPEQNNIPGLFTLVWAEVPIVVAP